jgi:hypothetical protein
MRPNVHVVGPLSSGVAAGTAGSATANLTSSQRITGKILGVYVDYLDTPPATTDVTIATAGEAHPAETILTLTDANTDGWFYPRTGIHTVAGVAMLYAAGGTAIPDLIPVDDKIKITIAQADANDYVNVYLLVED